MEKIKQEDKLIKLFLEFTNILVLIYFSGCLKTFPVTAIEKMLNSIYILACVLSIFYLLVRVLNNRKKICKRNFIIIIFSTIIISLSIVSQSNLIEPIRLLLTSIYVIYLVEYYSFDSLIKILYKTSVIVLIITISIIILEPGIGKMYYEGNIVFKGGFYHKNSLGAFLVYSYIIQVIYYFEIKKGININLIFLIALEGFLLVGTSSTTSYLSIGIVTIVFYLYKFYAKKIPLGRILISIHIVCYYLVFYGQKYNEVFMKIFNKDLSFTGRKLIWQVVIELISLNKWIGYGYGDIWGGSYEKDYILHYTFDAALGPHNGVLDWVLECGIVGFIGLSILLGMFFYGLNKIKRYKLNQITFSAMYITFFLIFYISERASQPDSLIFVLFLLCLALINKANKEVKKSIYNSGERK